MINININNKDYKVSENITVLEACRQVGINIPTLCYDERLEPEASYNICVKVFNEEFAEIAITSNNKNQESKILEELKYVKTTCSYCGVGCQMELVVKNEKVVDVKPVNVLPNKGLLCVKGKSN